MVTHTAVMILCGLSCIIGLAVGYVIGYFIQKEEPVSEGLEEASKEWLKPQLDKSYESYGEGKMMELTHFDGYAMLDAIEFGAKWQKEKDSILPMAGNSNKTC